MNQLPKMVISAVYKSKDGTWRGFTAPYDISCTASTAKEAMRKIDELTDLYEEGLKKYGYPKHLTVREISDTEDKGAFKQVLKYVLADIQKKMQKDFEQFQLEKKASQFKTKNILGTYFLAPSLT